MPQLLDELRQEHKSIAKVLGCLDRQMRIFETGGHPDFGIIAAVLDYFEGFPDQYHHPKAACCTERGRAIGNASLLS